MHEPATALPSAFPLRGGGAIELHPGGIAPSALGAPRRRALHALRGRDARDGRAGRPAARDARRELPLPERGLRRERRRIGRSSRRCARGSRRYPAAAARLARMAELDALARARRRTPVTAAVAAACVARLRPFQPSPPSTARRASSARSSSGSARPGASSRRTSCTPPPGHLLLNGLGLAILGGLAERALGSRGVAAVLTLAGIGSMLGCALAGYPRALGASGMVAGLAGALLWLELRTPESLPVAWRIPRRLFVGLLAVETLWSSSAFPTSPTRRTSAASRPARSARPRSVPSDGRPPGRAPCCARRPPPRSCSCCSRAPRGCGASVRPIRRQSRGAARCSSRLPDIPPGYLNDEAWRIAISDEPSAAALDVALRMAERAAHDTERAVPADPRYARRGPLPARRPRTGERDRRGGARPRAARALLPRAAPQVPRASARQTIDPLHRPRKRSLPRARARRRRSARARTRDQGVISSPSSGIATGPA